MVSDHFSNPELIPVPREAAGSSVLVPIPALGSLSLFPCVPLARASRKSRNPGHGWLAAGRSFPNLEHTDNLFHVQPVL